MKDNLNILFVSFNKLHVFTSATRIRPRKILDELEKTNHHVTSVFLYDFINSFVKILFSKHFDLVYIESKLHPLTKKNRFLLRLIRKKSTYISYYYRDIFWRFDIEKDSYSSEKWEKIKRNHRNDLIFLDELLDLFYFQSISFGRMFDLKTKIAFLPPGGSVREIEYNSEDRNGAIYVGGFDRRYGAEFLLDAFDRINKEKNIKLRLIIREKELILMSHLVDQYKEKAWLEIIHANESQLDRYMNESRIAIITLFNEDYNNLIIPVKIFEYASFGLPILSTKNNEISSFIQNEEIGEITDFSADEFAERFLSLYDDYNRLNLYSTNCLSLIKNKASWTKRTEQIIRDYYDFVEKKNNK